MQYQNKYNTKIWLISFFAYYALIIYSFLYHSYAKYSACTQMGLDPGASSLIEAFAQSIVRIAPALLIGAIVYYFAYVKKGTRCLMLFLIYTIICNVRMMLRMNNTGLFSELLQMNLDEPSLLLTTLGYCLVCLFFYIQCIQLYRHNKYLKK